MVRINWKDLWGGIVDSFRWIFFRDHYNCIPPDMVRLMREDPELGNKLLDGLDWARKNKVKSFTIETNGKIKTYTII